MQLNLLAFPSYCWKKEKRGFRAELSCCCFGLEEGREGGRQAAEKQAAAPTFVLLTVWIFHRALQAGGDLAFFGLCPKLFKSHLGKSDIGKSSRLILSWRLFLGSQATGRVIHDVK